MNIDFPRIRNSALLFALAGMITLTGYNLIGDTAQQAETIRLDLDTRLGGLQNNLQTRTEHQQIVERYRTRFLQTLEQGRFAEEDRMRWVATLKQEVNRIRIPQVRYTLGSRQVDSDPVLGTLAEISVYRTPLKLDMEMVHEGDLVELIESLAESGLGRFEARQCKLTRASITNRFTADQGNISATCSLDWISFDDTPPMAESMPGLL